MKFHSFFSLSLMVITLAGAVGFDSIKSHGNKERALNITYPAPPEPDSDVSFIGCGFNLVTFLISADSRLFYYEDDFFPKEKFVLPTTLLTEINWADEYELFSLIKTKNAIAYDRTNELQQKLQEGKINDSTYTAEVIKLNKNSAAVTVYIKPHNLSKYDKLIHLIDVLKTFKVSKFLVIDPTAEELNELECFNKNKITK